MKRLVLVAAALVSFFATVISAEAAPVYMRSTVGAPWGLSGNETQMNNVFGSGNWLDLRYETATPASVFSAANSFVFLEGGNSNANELETFIAANLTTIQNWVSAGGSLLVNSAPNEGDGMSMGFGVTLTYFDGSFTATAASGTHPVVLGPASPVGTSWTGSLFSHAHVSGGGLSPIILDSNLDTILGEMNYGLGHAIFGGLTLPFFTSHPSWTPQPNVANLHHNIIAYAAGLGVTAVPEPSSIALLGLGGLGLMTTLRRNRRRGK